MSSLHYTVQRGDSLFLPFYGTKEMKGRPGGGFFCEMSTYSPLKNGPQNGPVHRSESATAHVKRPPAEQTNH